MNAEPGKMSDFNEATKTDKAASVYNEYMKQLQQWSDNVKWQKWMWHHYGMLQRVALHTQLSNNRTNQNASRPMPHFTPRQPQQETATTNRARFQDYEIPSMLRRAAAEISDFCILFFFKTLILLLIMYYMGLDFSFDIQSDGMIGFKFIKMVSQADLDGDDDLNWDSFFKDENSELDHYFTKLESNMPIMLILTCLYRVLSAIYEWSFVWCLGSTPGKEFFGLKVVSCQMSTNSHAVNNGVAVIPGTNVDMYSAWLRSLTKNLMIAFMIPGFLSAFFYSHNRTSYDMIANTIVVKKHRRPHNR